MKVYVDSRHRVSGTNEEFVWQIPETVDIPDSWCYIDCVLVPNTFFSIRQNYNGKLYLKERVGTTDHYIVLNIAPGQYNGTSLATALQTVMNGVTQMGANTYTVIYDIDIAKIKITSSSATGNQFTIFGEVALNAGRWNHSNNSSHVDLNNTQSANKVFGFNAEELTGTAHSSNTAPTHRIPLIGDSVIDVQRHHCCYIHSDLGELGSSWGCRGESSVIRRVVVDAPQNGLAIDRHSTSWDAVEVGSKALRSMSFRLADDNGVTVDLQGHHWSFSLVFHEKL